MKRKASEEEEQPEHWLPVPPAHVRVGTLQVSGYAFGTLALGVAYPEEPVSEERARLVVEAALQSGVNLVDTADTYCPERGQEHSVERVLAQLRLGERGALVSSKGCCVRVPGDRSSRSWAPAWVSEPAKVQQLIRDSHAALGGHTPLDLWLVHHVEVGKEVQVLRAAQQMQLEGLVKHLGLCNVTAAQIRNCVDAGLPVDVVQVRFGPYEATVSNPAKPNPAKTSMLGVLDLCRELKIPVMAYGALGGAQARDGRRDLAKDKRGAKLREAAQRKGVSVQALTVSLMRHRFPDLIVLYGARTPEHAGLAREASSVRFTEEEVQELWTWTKK